MAFTNEFSYELPKVALASKHTITRVNLTYEIASSETFSSVGQMLREHIEDTPADEYLRLKIRATEVCAVTVREITVSRFVKAKR